ncbi:M23 family metallopeptidase [Microbacterium sp. LRZ72]|uniref:M23 family metallopeptidase n=1 Tax=Microbacterium sp. LRZ72 TaxID=2942481 RepID=UPI0029ACE086|nr:M23 family metallopeptidase [Microbacterium sp. LRZ72]MDX2377603.1 M23 family metallopeptidase [Microbacterium sp. LRZ72]
MPAPVAVAVAVASHHKALRRLAMLSAAAFLLFGVAIAAPLVGITAALAGNGTSAAQTDSVDSRIPAVVGEWGYPYAGGYTKGRGYGYHPVRGCAYCPADHKGYDLSQGCGASIFAAGPGVVTTAGSMGQFGNSVVVDHGDGVETIYAHLQWGSLAVTKNEQVSAGTRLGAEGTTGLSYGCHLHFELRIGGARLDPAPFMAARGLPLA